MDQGRLIDHGRLLCMCVCLCLSVCINCIHFFISDFFPFFASVFITVSVHLYIWMNKYNVDDYLDASSDVVVDNEHEPIQIKPKSL